MQDILTPFDTVAGTREELEGRGEFPHVSTDQAPSVADGLLAIAGAIHRLADVMVAIHNVQEEEGEECLCPECMAARESGEQ